jgi:hypothetical protein
MATLIWVPLILPLLLAAVSILQRSRSWTLWLPVSAAVVLLFVGVGLVLAVTTGGPLTAAGGLLR